MPSNPLALEDAIALVSAQAFSRGVTLTRTKLVKLLYFVDLRSWERSGRPVTGVEWRWHHYGPYSSFIVEATGRMAAAGELTLDSTANYYGSPEYRIHSVKALYYDPPSRQLTDLVREVVIELGHFAPAQIGDKSYDTEPMRLLVRSGHRGDLIEFPTSPPTKRDVEDVVRRYKSRVRHRTDSGDINQGLREDLAATSVARKAATTKLLVGD